MLAGGLWYLLCLERTPVIRRVMFVTVETATGGSTQIHVLAFACITLLPFCAKMHGSLADSAKYLIVFGSRLLYDPSLRLAWRAGNASLKDFVTVHPDQLASLNALELVTEPVKPVTDTGCDLLNSPLYAALTCFHLYRTALLCCLRT